MRLASVAESDADLLHRLIVLRRDIMRKGWERACVTGEHAYASVPQSRISVSSLTPIDVLSGHNEFCCRDPYFLS